MKGRIDVGREQAKLGRERMKVLMKEIQSFSQSARWLAADIRNFIRILQPLSICCTFC